MAKPPQCPFLGQDREFVIFSNGYLNLSVNILVGNIVLV